jgi:hypothetical protein
VAAIGAEKQDDVVSWVDRGHAIADLIFAR